MLFQAVATDSHSSVANWDDVSGTLGALNLSALGLCGKILLVRGLQEWLLWELPGASPMSNRASPWRLQDGPLLTKAKPICDGSNAWW